MKAIVKEACGDGYVALREVPEPVPGRGEVKLKVMAAGVCGTDIKIRHGQAFSRPPVVLGHELSGEVVECGEGVTAVEIGDRVVSETAQVICGTCDYCRSGHYLMCDRRLSIGYGMDGGMAAYCVVRADILHRLPEGVDYDNGALCEPAAVAVHAVLDHVRLLPTDVVLVSGAGAIGLLAAQVAKSCGAAVILTGLTADTGRLETARALGIDHAVDVQQGDVGALVASLTGGRGVDAAFECSGSLPGVRTAMTQLKKMGRLVQVGLTQPTLEIDYALLTAREIGLIGTFGHRWESWESALRLIADGKVRTAPLITHRFPLDEWEEAFRVAESQEGIKVLLYPNGRP